MMANKITEEEIVQINELYYECKSYAEVARRTGRSASTIKKYVNPDYLKSKEKDKKVYKFNRDLIPEADLYWDSKDNLGVYCVLSKEEKEILRGA